MPPPMPPASTTTPTTTHTVAVAAAAVLTPIASSSHRVAAAVRSVFHSGGGGSGAAFGGDYGGGGVNSDGSGGDGDDGDNIASGLTADASATYSFNARAVVDDLLTASQQKNYTSFEALELLNYDGLSSASASASSSSALAMAPTLQSDDIGAADIEEFFNSSTSLLHSASATLLDDYTNANSTNGTNSGNINDAQPNNYWGLLALVLVLGTAAGNILVCMAITHERRLQNITNYFLMSLAITDLMVAILVMPLGILTLVKGE